jgi:hypothetical protein
VFPKAFGVFLPFDNVNQGIFQEIRETVGNQANAFEVPFPTAPTVRAALAKVLGDESDRLEEGFPLLVGVIVYDGDFRLPAGRVGIKKKVLGLQAGGFKNGFVRATGMVEKKDFLFLYRNGKAGFLVLMSRTAGLPSVGCLPDVFEVR